MTKDEALKLALEALEACNRTDMKKVNDAITALKAALAQPERLAELGWQEIDCPICGGGARAFPKPEQEPVAIALNTGTKQGVKWLKNVEHGESLYTNPPAQRKPLTDEEIAKEFYKFESAGAWYQFARAIEAKLKEKNGG